MRQGSRPLAPSSIGRLFQGIGYPFAALGFLRQHQLWGLATIPIVVNVLLFVVVIALMVWLVVPWLSGVGAALAPAASAGFWAAIGAFFAKLLAVLLWILVPAAILIIGAFFIVLVGQAVASPFLDNLSEKVESIVLGTPPPKVSVGRAVQSVLVATADIVWTVVFFVAVNVPLLLINIIPLVGSAANAVLSFCFTALLLSQEFVGLALARKLVSYPNRWRVIWANKASALGFGVATMLILVVPGLNLVLLPLAAVGGTLLYCDLEAAGRVPSPASRTPAGVV
jgi:CysZ protein